MREKFLLSLLFVFAVISDQVTKIAVNSAYSLHSSRQIIGNFLRLTYIKNSGAAFGITFGNKNIMLIITIAVILFLIYLFISGKIRPETIPLKTALVVIIGGAIGNLIDRIRMGEVIDFIDMGLGSHRWPIYNLADVFVTLGMFIFIAHMIFYPEDHDKNIESEN